MFYRFTSKSGRFYGIEFVIALVLLVLEPMAFGQDLKHSSDQWRFQLRFRTETSAGSGRFHTLTKEETWEPKRTAIIVCDVWDAHHSINAVRRVEELAPRIDQVLKYARQSGATIVHSPSDCMESYKDHPSRKRAQSVPVAARIPAGMKSWCHRIDSEKAFAYPLDQSDGGEDDDPAEHAAWANELRAKGRKPSNPWQMESPLIAIDESCDFISDNGEEVWNILESRGIDNVILVGVHTNMCVLGRPFGLRNMVAAGKRVALLRDLTDTMYNPQRWPFVNHHTGTDLIVEYIEKCICPTISSDQLLGGKPFRFKTDHRPLVAIVMAEDEYETNRTLPQFAAKYLGNDFRVALVYSSDVNPNDVPGLEILDQAQAAIISVRRRPLPTEQMEIVRRFVKAGKPMLGIRTSSHAFVLRDDAPPEGLVAWPEFDAEVWGGNYTGHHGNALLPKIELVAENAGHPILAGFSAESISAGGSLYKTSPLADSAKVLLVGAISGEPPEPAAWTYDRADGGRSFYSSLGHKQDFENNSFLRMLFNSVCWATEREAFVFPNAAIEKGSSFEYWKVISVPSASNSKTPANSEPTVGDGWYRCFFKFDRDVADQTKKLKLPNNMGLTVWVNGTQSSIEATQDNFGVVVLTDEFVKGGELNLLVIRCANDHAGISMSSAPTLIIGERQLELSGKWQFRIGNDISFSSLSLPPKFAAAADIIFD